MTEDSGPVAEDIAAMIAAERKILATLIDLIRVIEADALKVRSRIHELEQLKPVA